MTPQVVIHCQPSLKTRCQADELNWKYSLQFGTDELDVFVNNIDELDDEELCSHYGLDYNQVNCMELV